MPGRVQLELCSKKEPSVGENEHLYPCTDLVLKFDSLLALASGVQSLKPALSNFLLMNKMEVCVST